MCDCLLLSFCHLFSSPLPQLFILLMCFNAILSAYLNTRISMHQLWLYFAPGKEQVPSNQSVLIDFFPPLLYIKRFWEAF